VPENPDRLLHHIVATAHNMADAQERARIADPPGMEHWASYARVLEEALRALRKGLESLRVPVPAGPAPASVEHVGLAAGPSPKGVGEDADEEKDDDVLRYPSSWQLDMRGWDGCQAAGKLEYRFDAESFEVYVLPKNNPYLIWVPGDARFTGALLEHIWNDSPTWGVPYPWMGILHWAKQSMQILADRPVPMLGGWGLERSWQGVQDDMSIFGGVAGSLGRLRCYAATPGRLYITHQLFDSRLARLARSEETPQQLNQFLAEVGEGVRSSPSYLDTHFGIGLVLPINLSFRYSSPDAHRFNMLMGWREHEWLSEPEEGSAATKASLIASTRQRMGETAEQVALYERSRALHPKNNNEGPPLEYYFGPERVFGDKEGYGAVWRTSTYQHPEPGFAPEHRRYRWEQYAVTVSQRWGKVYEARASVPIVEGQEVTPPLDILHQLYERALLSPYVPD
jgi:hypothetical protein